MANNIFEQFDEAYSRWSILDKVGKEMQLAGMWQKLCATYNYIIWIWQSRGYLTVDEYNYKNRIYELLRLSRGANRWSSESRVKLASTMPSRDRGGQNVKEEDVVNVLIGIIKHTVKRVRKENPDKK